ncbi:hypothetical protein CYR32_08630 [Chimaeribacter coloradensis]|uniref:Probable 2-phosphosulfolactate phosphatase n=1 Tax=Chimaeribacter coloradensis TaxID=2060068 RepID=A0A2N5E5K8_9GAMM|nr:2-phosphosulfolactate phosphatase [Chimaeribacter coloradensis]PLR36416.1 hypothetical protein CYR32_08630 [Chimaeribacter coloradensis]
MTWFSQNRFDVRLEWGLPAVEYLAGEADCAVIVDVMSFSTCVSLAVDNGARIYPYPWKEASAQAYGRQMGAFTASAERRFTGEGYSLSPASIRRLSAGDRLVLPSPNGSAVSFRAREKVPAVFSGCFRNLAATAEACRAYKRILLIPCGERWPDGILRPAVEDYVAAGGIIAALGREHSSPEAQAAAAAYHAHRQQALRQLRECASAVELRERGFEEDIALCLEENAGIRACRLHGAYYG